jgi:hypothetical protein
LILLGVDQLLALHAQLAQGFAAQVGQHEIGSRREWGMHLVF